MAATAEIKGKMTMDNSQVLSATKQASTAVSGFSAGGMAAFAGLAGGAVALGTKIVDVAMKIVQLPLQFAQAAAALVRLSSTMNVSSSTLNEWKDAARSTGADADGFANKIVKMLDSQEKAVGGNKELTEAFGKLGISEKELATLNTEELLNRVASGAQKSGTAISDLNKIMGRGAAAEYGATLKVLADQGMTGVDKQTEKVVGVFNNLNKAWEVSKDKLERGLMAMLAPLVEGMIPVIEGVTELIAAFMKFRELTGIDKVLGFVLSIFGNILKAIGMIVEKVNEFIGQLQKLAGIDTGPGGEGESEAKRKEIDAQRQRAMEEEAAKAKAESAEEKKKQKMREDLADLKRDLRASGLTPEEKGRAMSIAAANGLGARGDISIDAPRAADAMAGFGGFTGRQTDAGKSFEQRSIAIAETQAKWLESHFKQLEKIAEYTAELQE